MILCPPSEYSAQPVHHNLSRAGIVSSQGFKASSGGQRTLIRLRGCNPVGNVPRLNYYYELQYNLNGSNTDGSNTDGSFTVDDSNFFSVPTKFFQQLKKTNI